MGVGGWGDGGGGGEAGGKGKQQQRQPPTNRKKGYRHRSTHEAVVGVVLPLPTSSSPLVVFRRDRGKAALPMQSIFGVSAHKPHQGPSLLAPPVAEKQAAPLVLAWPCSLARNPKKHTPPVTPFPSPTPPLSLFSWTSVCPTHSPNHPPTPWPLLPHPSTRIGEGARHPPHPSLSCKARGSPPSTRPGAPGPHPPLSSPLTHPLSSLVPPCPAQGCGAALVEKGWWRKGAAAGEQMHAGHVPILSRHPHPPTSPGTFACVHPTPTQSMASARLALCPRAVRCPHPTEKGRNLSFPPGGPWPFCHMPTPPPHTSTHPPTHPPTHTTTPIQTGISRIPI